MSNKRKLRRKDEIAGGPIIKQMADDKWKKALRRAARAAAGVRADSAVTREKQRRAAEREAAAKKAAGNDSTEYEGPSLIEQLEFIRNFLSGSSFLERP